MSKTDLNWLRENSRFIPGEDGTWVENPKFKDQIENEKKRREEWKIELKRKVDNEEFTTHKFMISGQPASFAGLRCDVKTKEEEKKWINKGVIVGDFTDYSWCGTHGEPDYVKTLRRVNEHSHLVPYLCSNGTETKIFGVWKDWMDEYKHFDHEWKLVKPQRTTFTVMTSNGSTSHTFPVHPFFLQTNLVKDPDSPVLKCCIDDIDR
jgi:hypothetical protein